jgi:hypothetical protein
MFTVVKVRKDQKPGDYRDPGWYQHPPGSVAYEWTGELPAAVRNTQARGQAMPAKKPAEVEVTVRKPTGHQGHH